MSVVTNIIISGYFHKEDEILNDLEGFTSPGMPFTKIENRKVGGNKALEGDLLIGAFDSHKNFEKLFEIIKGFKKYDNQYLTHCIQIFIKNEDDDFWIVFTIDELKLSDFKY